MYSFQIYRNNIWRNLHPYYEQNGISRSIWQDEVFSRDVFNGSLTIYETYNDYDYIVSTRDTYGIDTKIEFRVQKDSITIFTGYLLLTGTYNDIEKICSLPVETNDQYSKIINNQEIEYDIIKGVTPIVSCSVDTSFNLLEFSYTNVLESTLFYEPVASTSIIYARERGIYPNIQADEIVNTDGWVLLQDNNDGTKTLVRDWQYSGDYNTPDADDILMLSGAVEIEEYEDEVATYVTNEIGYYHNHTQSGDTIIHKSQVIGLFTEPNGFLSYYFVAYTYYGQDSILYTRLRRLDNTIQWLIGQMDSSILFDSSSFSYFDENEDLKHLLIAGITDIILKPDGTGQQDSPSTKGLIAFKSIIDMFRSHPFHLYFLLEEIGGNYYFRLKHISEINKNLGVGSFYNLTTLYNKNWSIDKGVYTYKKDKFFSKLTLKTVSNNVDFLYNTIETGLVNIEKDIVKDFETFYFDIWDIQGNSSRYPNDSVSNFCLISAQLGTTEYLSTITNNVTFPYDIALFNTTTKQLLLQVNSLTKAYAFSNQLYLESGVDYKISFTSIVTTQPILQENIKIFFSDGSVANPNDTIKSNVIEISDSTTEYTLTPIETGFLYLAFYRDSITEATDIILNGVSIQLESYIARKSTGKISGLQVLNADLSFANLLENHGKYEFPSTPVTFNGSSQAVELLKVKSQETILVPIYDQTNIDFNYLVKTNLGNLEPEKLTIYFNEQFAEFNGKF